MAIKINNTNVIDDTRKFIPVTIEANSSVGTDGQVLESTGTGLRWGNKVSAKAVAFSILFGY